MSLSMRSAAARWTHRLVTIALCSVGACAPRGGAPAVNAISTAPGTAAAAERNGPTRPPPSPSNRPSTRAERTKYRETSSYDDVVRFIDSLGAANAPIVVQSLATSARGRPIPLIIASRPRVSSPVEARRTGRPIVYLQAGVRVGDAAGTEAVLARLRDWSVARAPNILDSLVVLVVPMYSADVEDITAESVTISRSTATSETPSAAPSAAGTKGWAKELNNDLIKAEASATRGLLAMLNAWEPDVFVELQTANGRGDGNVLTSTPALHPASPLASYTADTLLAEIQRRLQRRHRLKTSTFVGTPAASVARGHVSGAGTNYYGLRGRISMLNESYARDPLAKRVTSTGHFVQETLSLLAERRTELRSSIRAGVARSTFLVANTTPVSLRSAIARVPSPHGYALDESWTSATRLLRLHGVTVIPTTRAMTATLQVFDIDQVERASTLEAGHQATTVSGRWRDTTRVLPAGTLIVAASTPRDLLAMILIDPESADGLFTWNIFDGALVPGREAPVVRLMAPLRLYSPQRSGDDFSPR